MNHRANADFWNDYHALPADIRARTVGWSRRAVFGMSAPLSVDPEGRIHRDKARRDVCATREEYLWFWIGEHNIYDALTG